MDDWLIRYKEILPVEYLDFLNDSNGFEGYVGDKLGYVVLWNKTQLSETWKNYKFIDHLTEEWFPVGSNGGGEVISIKLTSNPQSLFLIPFIGMDEKDAIVYCHDFSSLYTAIKAVL